MAIVVSKEKNILSILDTTKTGPYTLDINTGILCGIKGNPLVNTPSSVRSYFESGVSSKDGNVCMTIYHLLNSTGKKMADLPRFTELLVLADKLQNIGYTYTRLSDTIVSGEVAIINAHWKEICKWMPTRGDQTLRDFLKDHAKHIWIERNHLSPDGHLFTEEMSEWMYRSFKDYNWPEKRLHIIAGWLVQGLWNYEISSGARFNRICDLFRWADDMELEVSKGNFFKQWGDARATYQIWKDREINFRLERHQMRHKQALSFESDELMVVIPTTKQEFLDEASAQNNCVARLYMPEVADGNTHVVFIRQKSNPSKSYITCEVNGAGRIKQYYLAHNRSVWEDDNPTAYAFRLAYQDYLRKQVW